MRPLVTCFVLACALGLPPPHANAAALHAPRVAQGKIQLLTPAGCDGPQGTNPNLYSEQAVIQAYLCRDGGSSTAFLFDSRTRQTIPVFAASAGNPKLLWLSRKGRQLAILSDVALTEEPIVGDWALYLFAPRRQRMEKVLEDDPAGLGELIADDDCPTNRIVSLDAPSVELLDDRGTALVRLSRATASGACGPLYMEVER